MWGFGDGVYELFTFFIGFIIIFLFLLRCWCQCWSMNNFPSADSILKKGESYTTYILPMCCFAREIGELARRNPPSFLVLYDSPIKFEPQIKFLGLILDDRLSYLPHIRHLYTNCQPLDLLRRISATTWNADRRTILRLFLALWGQDLIMAVLYTTRPLNRTWILFRMKASASQLVPYVRHRRWA